MTPSTQDKLTTVLLDRLKGDDPLVVAIPLASMAPGEKIGDLLFGAGRLSILTIDEDETPRRHYGWVQEVFSEGLSLAAEADHKRASQPAVLLLWEEVLLIQPEAVPIEVETC